MSSRSKYLVLYFKATPQPSEMCNYIPWVSQQVEPEACVLKVVSALSRLQGEHDRLLQLPPCVLQNIRARTVLIWITHVQCSGGCPVRAA
jgi:hypothetical protein